MAENLNFEVVDAGNSGGNSKLPPASTGKDLLMILRRAFP
jgi:hypothetical protein